VDGIVCDTNMAKNMSFSGRYGNSCGIPFVSAQFFKQHRQYEKFAPYVKDRLSQEWTDFASSLSEKTKVSQNQDRNLNQDQNQDRIQEQIKKPKGGFKLTRKGRERKNKSRKR
jgi:hypothetical protein